MIRFRELHRQPLGPTGLARLLRKKPVMPTTEHIAQLLELSQRLIDLSVAGSEAAEDDGCLLLFGIVQDCAYKMRRAAREELQVHERLARGKCSAESAG